MVLEGLGTELEEVLRGLAILDLIFPRRRMHPWPMTLDGTLDGTANWGGLEGLLGRLFDSSPMECIRTIPFLGLRLRTSSGSVAPGPPGTQPSPKVPVVPPKRNEGTTGALGNRG